MRFTFDNPFGVSDCHKCFLLSRPSCDPTAGMRWSVQRQSFRCNHSPDLDYVSRLSCLSVDRSVGGGDSSDWLAGVLLNLRFKYQINALGMLALAISKGHCLMACICAERLMAPLTLDSSIGVLFTFSIHTRYPFISLYFSRPTRNRLYAADDAHRSTDSTERNVRAIRQNEFNEFDFATSKRLVDKLPPCQCAWNGSYAETVRRMNIHFM